MAIGQGGKMTEKGKVDLSDPKQRNKYWTDFAVKHLLGRKITKVAYLSDKEANDSMWYSKPVVFQLDGKDWVYPMRDDEGNDGGALVVGEEILPVLSVGDE